MNIKEHLQFFVLMIPTLLLLVAAVVTLASPTASARTYETTFSEPQAVQLEAVPLSAVTSR
jgi:hypothetical protein